MQEIRFNNPIKKEEPINESPSVQEEVVNKTKPSKSKNFSKVFVYVVLAAILVAGFLYFKDLGTFSFGGRSDSWSAVFLSNGQVYFGKIDSNSKNEMVLTQVYYLQADEGVLPSQQSDSLNQSRFKLVKLGQELHGPEDMLIINKTNVIFYEYLREDSKVVQSIREFK